MSLNATHTVGAKSIRRGLRSYHQRPAAIRGNRRCRFAFKRRLFAFHDETDSGGDARARTLIPQPILKSLGDSTVRQAARSAFPSRLFAGIAVLSQCRSPIPVGTTRDPATRCGLWTIGINCPPRPRLDHLMPNWRLQHRQGPPIPISANPRTRPGHPGESPP